MATLRNPSARPGRPSLSRAYWRQSGLALADVCAVNIAFAAAYWLRYEYGLGGFGDSFVAIPYRQYLAWGFVLSLIMILAFQFEGLYSNDAPKNLPETLYAIVAGTVVGVAILTVMLYFIRPDAQSRLMLSYAAGLTIGLVGAIRWIDTAIYRRRIKRGIGVTRTLIVGAGEVGRAVMRNIIAQPELGYQVVGFLDDDFGKRSQPIGRFQPLGQTDDLAQVLKLMQVDSIILTLPWAVRDKIVGLVDDAEQAGVQVRIVPDLFQMSLNRVDMASLGGIPLIGVRGPRLRGWAQQFKRIMDISLAGLLMVLCSPIMAAIALAIRIETRGPVLFRQSRLGRDGKPFTCLKFRSMIPDAENLQAGLKSQNEATGPIFKMRDDPRITRVGRLIRRLSFDELPQLYNVLVGDMSLVGPRPPMPSEVESYADWHRRRLDIAPGLTGLWQVSGRSNLTFDEMVMLDLFYAEHWSLLLDLKILLRTVPSVLLGTGAY